MKISIKTKIIFTLLLFIILPVTISGVLSYHKSQDILISEIKEDSLKTMENANDFFIHNYISETEQAVRILSNDKRLQYLSSNPGVIKEPLKEWNNYRRLNSNIWYIYLGTKEGDIYVAPDWKPYTGYDPRTRPWYKTALAGQGQIVWTEPYLEYISHQVVVTATKTIEDSGQLIGVFAIDTSLEKLSEIVGKIKFGKDGFAILLDQKGNIIAHPNKVLLENVSNEDWFKKLPNKQKGSIFYKFNNRDTFISYVTVPQTGWKLVGFIPKETLEKQVAPIKNSTVTVGIVSSLIAIVLSIIISNTMTRKLKKIINSMAEVGKGNFKACCNQTCITHEFTDLCNTFNNMVKTIENLIEQRKQTETELQTQKGYFQQLFENSPESIAILDNKGKVCAINKQFEEFFQYTLDEIKGQYINEIIVPKELLAEGKTFTKDALQNITVEQESVRLRKDGSLVEVFILGYPIVIKNELVGVYAIYRDITARKETEKQLKYISLHDPLTGVYNRAYFEQQMNHLEEAKDYSNGLILCDVDGLKLINDTLGHNIGDKILQEATRAIKSSLPTSAVLCRIGGDEFAVLISNVDEQNLEIIHKNINNWIDTYNNSHKDLSLSISIGFALRRFPTTSMDEVFKEADNNMYKEKLHRSQSTRSAIVRTLTKALETRDFITEGHADRMQELVEGLAKVIQVPERKIKDLRLLAQFHDIGKVGIPDKLLFKPGPLTPEEQKEMQTHCELGYRIAMASPDLNHIADWILKHHEWWNGEGYPLGLEGEEIPLECRILAIVDAYDAMTNDRPYRKAMSHQEALEELKRCSGINFDPNLVEKFIQMVKYF